MQENNTIRAVIFDFGNVICTFDNDKFLKRIEKHTDKSFKELKSLIYEKSDLPKKYETGLISSDEFFKKIKELCGLDISKTEFVAAFTDIFKPIQPMFDLIQRLKKNGYILAMLSNTSQWDFKYGLSKISVFDLFDYVTTSYDVKAMKPHFQIYKDSLKKVGLHPSQCVYLDDIAKYVDAFKVLGGYGIVYDYKNHKTAENELRNLGVKC